MEASFNEFLHSSLTKDKFMMKLDEAIGMTYFDVDKTVDKKLTLLDNVSNASQFCE